MTSIELFDKHGTFVMPSAEALATLSAEQQEGFETVRAAAEDRERAAATTKAAQDHVARCAANLVAAENGLRELRPPIDPVTAARQWMRSNK